MVYCMTVYDCMIGHVNLVIPEVFQRPHTKLVKISSPAPCIPCARNAGGTFGERGAEDSRGQQWRCVLLWLGAAVLGRNEVWLGRYQVLAMKRWSWSYQSPSIYYDSMVDSGRYVLSWSCISWYIKDMEKRQPQPWTVLVLTTGYEERVS